MPNMDEEDIRRFIVRGTGSQMGANQSVKDLLDLIRTELTFQHQALATLAQASPVQNTWYTILDTTLNARVYGIYVAVATTGETLQVKITIDGQVLTSADIAAVAGTQYTGGIAWDGNAYFSTTRVSAGWYSALDARSIKIEVRKTTANGTGTLSGVVTYAKR